MARRSARVAERRGQQRNLSNPPFDKRILTLPGIAGVPGGLQRGKITSSIDAAQFGAAVGWTCRFLYNPSTITLSHGVTEDVLPDNERSKYDIAEYMGDTQTSLNWALLFDRTYETWDAAYKDKPAGRYGVYSDIRALYGMVGMVDQTPIADWDLITWPMLLKPVQVYFGGRRSLTYFGRLSGMGVQYTHWTSKMVPNRAVVDLSMSIYPKDAFDPTARAGSSDAAAGGKKRQKKTVPPPARAPGGSRGGGFG